MDVESKHTVRFLKTLAHIKQQFVELAQKLRTRPDVTQVLHSLECLKNQMQDMVEGYIDIELNNGKSIALWLEINWDDEQWVIESCVLLNDNQSQSVQEVMREFPDRIAETLEECIEQLLQATSDLVNSAEPSIDSVTD
jgi:hypothetical protein